MSECTPVTSTVRTTIERTMHTHRITTTAKTRTTRTMWISTTAKTRTSYIIITSETHEGKSHT